MTAFANCSTLIGRSVEEKGIKTGNRGRKVQSTSKFDVIYFCM
jgi:hypothetical protein